MSPDNQPKPASPTIVAQQRHLLETLPFSDRQDFEDAHRGFIAALEPGVVRNSEGRVVWDNDSYDFLAGDAPDTESPASTKRSRKALFTS